MCLNSISNVNKDIGDRGLSQKFPIFVIGLRRLVSETYDKKKKRYACLVSWKRRKFRTWYKRWHSGSHAVAWAAIIISVPKVSYDLHLDMVALQFHALAFYNCL